MTNTKPNRQNFKQNIVTECPLKGREHEITYKNVQFLEKFISTRGRIMPTSKTGVCAKNQRKLMLAIKRARYMALLPYTKYV